jgi:hypothetical protein
MFEIKYPPSSTCSIEEFITPTFLLHRFVAQELNLHVRYFVKNVITQAYVLRKPENVHVKIATEAKTRCKRPKASKDSILKFWSLSSDALWCSRKALTFRLNILPPSSR